MTRLTKFEEYRDRYSDSYVLEKTEDGILLMRMHTAGGSVDWTRAYYATSELLADIAGDRDVRVVIYTGTGQNFNADWRSTEALPTSAEAQPWTTQRSADSVEEQGWFGRNRHNNMLDIDAIMIAAVNGPVTIHSELPIMCDVVLASEDAYFQDLSHFVYNLAPGDGIQNVWPRIIGWNRYRYWQLTGQRITAQQAHEWGAVNEVLPKDKVLDRAWEIAHYLTRFSPVTLRNTRRTFVQELKRGSVNDLLLGQSMELLGMTSIPPDPTLWDGGVLPE